VHVHASERFSDVLLHPGGAAWGWQSDYIDVIATKFLQDHRIPAFDLAVWLYHSEPWLDTDTQGRDIIHRLFAEFAIDAQEVVLFDVSIPPLATPCLQEKLISNDELLNITSLPPGKGTEGTLLQRLELTDVGPTKKLELLLAPRLNVITGDNALGKSFVLDCIWWALTGSWIEYPARPRQDATSPHIAFQIGRQGHTAKAQVAKYIWRQLTWDVPPKRNNFPGLSLFAQTDGSFAVWDPAKYILAREEHYRGRVTDALTQFSRTSILVGCQSSIEG
jgi:hypothetical protein